MSADPRMPAVFVGHGNPMHAIEKDAYTEAWQRLSLALPRPRAILSVSAHWYVRGTRLTAMERPRTIHDFGGFPRELYAVEYPAHGDPALARRVRDLLAPLEVALDDEWGLDHGTWSVLVHMYPDASVPVVQLSIDRTKPASFHYELGARLAPLRREGVLVLGSGNLVHNLETLAWGDPEAAPFEWAVRFEEKVRRHLDRKEHAPLVAYETLGAEATLAVPTPDHYLPLLYVLGLAEGATPAYPVEGFDLGSIYMLSVQV